MHRTGQFDGNNVQKTGKQAFIPEPSYTNPSMGITHMTAYTASAFRSPPSKAKRLGEHPRLQTRPQRGEWEGAGEYESNM